MPDLINRPTTNSFLRRHRYYAKSGFYAFLFKNALKVLTIVGVLIVVFILAEKWIIDTDEFFEYLFKDLNNVLVIAVFGVSQALLGFIPPDLFIIWSRKFDNPWLIISLLAVLSYLGGIVSFVLGVKIQSIPRVNAYVTTRFKNISSKVRRWGGLFIIVAALFPIPYSTVCFIIGMMKYPFRIFLFLGLFRILRFFIYGMVLFGILSL